MSADILVTGADGFIGSALVPALRSRGAQVSTFSLCDGDIGRSGVVLPPARSVIHLAARTYVPDSWQNPAAFYDVNVLGTVNVLELCRRHKARLTMLSSYVYGHPQQLPIDEDHPLSAVNPYAHTKLMAEDTARNYVRWHGLSVTIIRPFNIYGPGQDERFLIPSIMRQVLDPAQATIRVADARPKRDYLFIDDLVGLLVRTIEQPAAESSSPLIFNAGAGCSHSVAEVAQLANRVTGQAKPLEDGGQVRPLEVMDVYADIGRAHRATGWRPEISLEEGLRRIGRSLGAG
jgi:nucleoside-diphosphate-sugar epimerase